VLGLLLDWLEHMERRDDVATAVCGLLGEVCLG
jgi:hypothetical protein